MNKCPLQLGCTNFKWIRKARNEHIRLMEICTLFIGYCKDGHDSENIEGDYCPISKGDLARRLGG